MHHSCRLHSAPSLTLRSGAGYDDPTIISFKADDMNSDEAVKAMITDPVLQQRLAKYLVLQCFRNSALENLHAGMVPGSKSGDYTDVIVHTPFGEIAWGKLSRFDDAEMKVLMMDVVNRTYKFIQELFDDEAGAKLLLQLAERDPLPNWENPRYIVAKNAGNDELG
jgi:hypothetical protein